MIPEDVGSGLHRKSVQNRTLAVWSALALTAVFAFYQSFYRLHNSTRAAALGLVFPGAGYVACGNWLGTGLFILTVLTQPLVLFAVCSPSRQHSSITANDSVPVVWRRRHPLRHPPLDPLHPRRIPRRRRHALRARRLHHHRPARLDVPVLPTQCDQGDKRRPRPPPPPQRLPAHHARAPRIHR